MFNFNAKVHKSGSKIRIYDGDKFLREINASAKTFQPAEAKEFAEELVAELEKESQQMVDPAAQPTVVNQQQKQDVSLSEVSQNATGNVDVEELEELLDVEEEEKQEVDKDVENKVASYKAKIIKLQSLLINERKERTIERKARRGLAIAKQMVANGVLENNFETIRNKIAEIVEMETPEIDRLEKKTSGEKEFETPTEAFKEARRLKRIARLNRVAAEDAQEEGDEEMADELDQKADIAEQKAASYEKIGQEMIEEKQEETEKVEEKVEEKQEETEKVEEKVEEKQEEVTTEEKQEVVTTTEEKQEIDEDDTEMDIMMMASLAKKYRRIASKHRKLAEEAEAKGEELEADNQDELANLAEEKAEDLESKCSSKKTSSEEVKDEVEEKQEETTEEVVEEKQEETEVVDEEKQEETTEEVEEKQEETETEEKTEKKASKLTIKRSEEVIDGFGSLKTASVEKNVYSNDPEVSSLETLWTKSRD